jgi:drug/metabolite transporter (DMT)-like permease
MPSTTIPPRALVLLALLTLVWGTNWPLFPLAMAELSVWTFRATTALGGGLLLLGLARLRGQDLTIPRQHWPTLFVCAFCYLFVWNVAAAWSATLIPSGQTAVLGFTMPLWSALFSWLLFRERLGRRQLAAIALGGAAVLSLMIPGLGLYAAAPLGFALGLVAGIGWALGTLALQRRPVGAPALVMTGWQLLATAVPLTLIALVTGRGESSMPGTTTVLVVAYITIVPMSLGNLCWMIVVRLVPANVLGVTTILVPVVAMLSGAFVHREPLGPLQFAAMACCVGGLSLVLLKPRQPLSRRDGT